MALVALFAARHAARQASEVSGRLISLIEGDALIKSLHAEAATSRVVGWLTRQHMTRAGALPEALLEGVGKRAFMTGTGKALVPFAAGEKGRGCCILQNG
jgi:hypothetical protein